MSYTPKKPISYNPSNVASFALVQKSSAASEYPILYTDDAWDKVESGSDLANILGGPGQYSQKDINLALAESVSVSSGVTDISYSNHQLTKTVAGGSPIVVATFANVAQSGSFNDLINTPTLVSSIKYDNDEISYKSLGSNVWTSLYSFNLVNGTSSNSVIMKGSGSSATAERAFALGYNTTASDYGAIAIGNSTMATNDYSFCGGCGNGSENPAVCSGDVSFAFYKQTATNPKTQPTYGIFSNYCAILGGENQTINGNSHKSAIIAGDGNVISGGNIVVLAGHNINASNPNTVYMHNIELFSHYDSNVISDTSIIANGYSGSHGVLNIFSKGSDASSSDARSGIINIKAFRTDASGYHGGGTINITAEHHYGGGNININSEEGDINMNPGYSTTSYTGDEYEKFKCNGAVIPTYYPKPNNSTQLSAYEPCVRTINSNTRFYLETLPTNYQGSMPEYNGVITTGSTLYTVTWPDGINMVGDVVLEANSKYWFTIFGTDGGIVKIS